MGREIRRVPLDFNHPLGEVWTGFLNPYPSKDYSHECWYCNGSGLNAETKKLYDTWYDSDGHGHRWDYERDNEGRAIGIVEKYPGACRRWCDKLTQDEVDALVEDGRYHDITHIWDKENREWIEKNPPVKVAAEMVNADNAPGARSWGHDALNMWTCVRTRANRLGVYGKCEVCHGEGRIIHDEEVKKLADEWEPYGPPVGEGWQVWETVSEGSPITPVFATAEELVDYLVNVGTSWGQKYSRQAAEAFCKDGGWVPSAMGVPGVGWVTNIEAAPYLGGKDE